MDEALRQAALSIITPTLASSRERLGTAIDALASVDRSNPVLPAMLDLAASISDIEKALVQLVTVLLDADKLK